MLRYLDDLTLDPQTNSTESTPPGFNARRHPIIARHFYGVEPPPPWQHISTPLARVVARLRIVDDAESEAA